MLHSLAKSEMRRQEIRKQLQETDQEVMEWLRVFSVSLYFAMVKIPVTITISADLYNNE